MCLHFLLNWGFCQHLFYLLHILWIISCFKNMGLFCLILQDISSLCTCACSTYCWSFSSLTDTCNLHDSVLLSWQKERNKNEHPLCNFLVLLCLSSMGAARGRGSLVHDAVVHTWETHGATLVHLPIAGFLLFFFRSFPQPHFFYFAFYSDYPLCSQYGSCITIISI